MLSQEEFQKPDEAWFAELRASGPAAVFVEEEQHRFRRGGDDENKSPDDTEHCGGGGGGVSAVLEQLAGPGVPSGAELADALLQVYQILAWRFNPQDAEAVMRVEFQRVVTVLLR